MSRPDAWLLIALLASWSLATIADDLRRIRKRLDRHDRNKP